MLNVSQSLSAAQSAGRRGEGPPPLGFAPPAASRRRLKEDPTPKGSGAPRSSSAEYMSIFGTCCPTFKVYENQAGALVGSLDPATRAREEDAGDWRHHLTKVGTAPPTYPSLE